MSPNDWCSLGLTRVKQPPVPSATVWKGASGDETNALFPRQKERLFADRADSTVDEMAARSAKFHKLFHRPKHSLRAAMWGLSQHGSRPSRANNRQKALFTSTSSHGPRGCCASIGDVRVVEVRPGRYWRFGTVEPPQHSARRSGGARGFPRINSFNGGNVRSSPRSRTRPRVSVWNASGRSTAATRASATRSSIVFALALRIFRISSAGTPERCSSTSKGPIARSRFASRPRWPRALGRSRSQPVTNSRSMAATGAVGTTQASTSTSAECSNATGRRTPEGASRRLPGCTQGRHSPSASRNARYEPISDGRRFYAVGHRRYPRPNGRHAAFHPLRTGSLVPQELSAPGSPVFADALTGAREACVARAREMNETLRAQCSEIGAKSLEAQRMAAAVSKKVEALLLHIAKNQASQRNRQAVRSRVGTRGRKPRARSSRRSRSTRAGPARPRSDDDHHPLVLGVAA
jgi:hypothetical protein